MASLMIILMLLPIFAFIHPVHVHGADPDPLQDICVADLNSKVRVNGFTCKDPSSTTSKDFFFGGLATPGSTNNSLGIGLTPAMVTELPGLNTQGLSMARIDYAPWGLNPPHVHPRATEMIFVVEGKVLAGFVTADPNHTFYSQKLEKGDVFVFPRGLVHFNMNIGEKNAIALVAFNSQNPGAGTIANNTFGANPPIADFILAKTYNIEKSLVDELQAWFSP